MKKIAKKICVILVLLFLLVSQTVFAEGDSNSENTVIDAPESVVIIHEDPAELTAGVKKVVLNSSHAQTSEWNQYASDYYYNKMNTNKQNLYKALDALCYSYMATEEPINADIIDVNGDKTGVTSCITYTDYGVTSNDAIAVMMIFRFTNPQYYFINEYYWIGNGNIAIGMYDEFADGTTRSQCTQNFKTKIDQWVSEIGTEANDISKENKAHTMILQNASYDLNAMYNQSCYSLFMNTNGATVCAGYAQAFELLCNAVGIDTICITSDTHEWNQIEINDNWYNVDCTWNDTGNTSAYYNITTAQLKELDKSKAHTPSVFWSVYLPDYEQNQSIDVNNTYTYGGISYSAVFEGSYYLNKYADLKEAFGNDYSAAFMHFINYGMSEGRQGISTFAVNSYRNQYADLRRAYGNNLKAYYQHYINYGKAEGRSGTGCTTLKGAITTYNGINYALVYNYEYYTSKHADIKNAYGSDDAAVLAHFVNYGIEERRQAIITFNVSSYRNQYADLRRAYGNNINAYYLHYVNYGKAEGRQGTGCTTLQGAITTYNGINYESVYNYNYYTSKNADIKNAYGSDDLAVLEHFINYGMSEGRLAIESFNVNIYKKRYADLRNAYGNNLKAYYMHYIIYGKAEGRSAI